MFGMKKLLKKVCMFGVSAAMSLNLCSNFVKADVPTFSHKGVSVGSTTIGQSEYLIPQASINLSSGLTFNEQAQRIINSVTGVTVQNGQNSTQLRFIGGDRQVALYLRVADSDSFPSENSDWVKYDDATSLDDPKLMRTLPGEYYVYYYIDSLESGYADQTGPNS